MKEYAGFDQNGRRIIEQNGYKVMTVSSANDIKVISSPQRQNILKLLKSVDKPLHGKDIADRLELKPASVHFHLKKLEDIGAVRVHHTQSINGITARFYEAAIDEIVMEENFLKTSDDLLTRQKILMTANTFNTCRNSFIKALRRKMQESSTDKTGAKDLLTILNKILFLSKDETGLLYKELAALFEKYGKASPDKNAYSLFLSINAVDDNISISPDKDTD